MGVVLTLALGSALECPSSPTEPSRGDVLRAKRTTQTARVGGTTHGEIAEKINAQVAAAGVPQRECGAHSLEELNQLTRDLFCHLSDALGAHYDGADGRKPRFGSIAEYEAAWAAEAASVAADATGGAHDALRAAKCAENLMLFTHHTTDEAKRALVHELGVTLPTLPALNATAHRDARVADTVASSYTCQTGHGMTAATDVGSDHVLPHWPKEVHYNGTGYGAYPFWAGGGGSGGHGAIEVWWSESKAAEKFWHESAYMSECQGYTGASPTPAYHLMTGVLGSAKGYLYTADESYCCESTGAPEDLSAPQSDFMDLMDKGDTYTVTTAYYTGEAQWYTMTLDHEPVSAFWYATTPDGLPLQQGEGGYGPNDPVPPGIFIYHEYNPDSFLETEHDESVFEVPRVCKTTTHKCQFP